MAVLPEGPICAFCSFTNLAVAKFCGGCGARLTVGDHAVVSHDEPEDLSQPVIGGKTPKGPSPVEAVPPTHSRHPRDHDSIVSAPRRAGATAGLTAHEGDTPPSQTGIPLASLTRAVADGAVVLLILGLVVAALAQLGLYFAIELNVRAPMGLSLLLAIGVAAFALGSAGLRMRRSNSEPAASLLDLKASPSPSCLPARSPLGMVGMAVGGMGLALLLYMLAAGSESGSAIAVWMLVMAAFALPFLSLATATNWRVRTRIQAWIRPHAWDLLAILALVSVYLAINLHDLRGWYYAAIGDEYLFYEHAKRIVDDGIVRPFSQEGVYNKHPVMSSVFQAGVMRIFGADYLGWKLSETLNAALTIPAIYLLAHQLGGRRAAIVGAATFAFSHYVFAFAHTGYNNLSPLPVAVWAIALFVLGWKRENALLMYLAGVIAGLGFYTHYSGRAVLPIMVLFSLTLGSPRKLIGLWPLGLGFILTVAPTFVVEQEGVLTRMFAQVVGGYSEVVTGSVGQRLLDNVILNLPAFNYSATVHTYVYGALLDPVSGLMAALGIAFALGNLRDPAFRLLLAWFAVAMFMTGILSPYPHVAVTRLMFVVPPLALLAGLMAARLRDLIPFEQLRIPARIGSAGEISAYAALLAVILALNLWQFWHVAPSVFPHSREAVALGAFRSDACGADLQETLFVGDAVGDGSLLQKMLSSMHPDRPAPIGVSHSELAGGAQLPVPLPDCLVFLNPYAVEALRLQQELGRSYPDGRLLPFSNPSGTTTVATFSIE